MLRKKFFSKFFVFEKKFLIILSIKFMLLKTIIIEYLESK